MVKIPMDEDKIEDLLEKQKNQREEKKDWLDSIDEADLTGPAIAIIEDNYISHQSDYTWYIEPKIQVRERHPNETSGKVSEEPDLLCEVRRGGATTYYVVELKKTVGKKAVGQTLHYYWALKNGIEMIHRGSTYELSEDAMIIAMVGGVRWQQPYYEEFFGWVRDNMNLEGGLEKLGIHRSQIMD